MYRLANVVAQKPLPPGLGTVKNEIHVPFMYHFERILANLS